MAKELIKFNEKSLNKMKDYINKKKDLIKILIEPFEGISITEGLSIKEFEQKMSDKPELLTKIVEKIYEFERMALLYFEKDTLEFYVDNVKENLFEEIETQIGNEAVTIYHLAPLCVCEIESEYLDFNLEKFFCGAVLFFADLLRLVSGKGHELKYMQDLFPMEQIHKLYEEKEKSGNKNISIKAKKIQIDKGSNDDGKTITKGIVESYLYFTQHLNEYLSKNITDIQSGKTSKIEDEVIEILEKTKSFYEKDIPASKCKQNLIDIMTEEITSKITDCEEMNILKVLTAFMTVLQKDKNYFMNEALITLRNYIPVVLDRIKFERRKEKIQKK